MANLAGSYDESAEPSSDFAPLPDGSYRASISESGINPIGKSGTMGENLTLTWLIEDGEHRGRMVWHRLNMWASDTMKNASKVREIANQQFAQVRHATGNLHVQESEELHGISCIIRLGTYNGYNEVKSVSALDKNAPRIDGSPAQQGQAQSPAQRQSPAQSSGGQSRPWKK